MGKVNNIAILFLGLAVFALTACGQKPPPERELLQAEKIPVPQINDGGVVIAETKIIGIADASDITFNSSDCADGEGFGITVSSSLEENKYLFNREGNPCEASKTIYDGKLKINHRATDPSVSIAFIDKYGTRYGETTNEILIVEVEKATEIFPTDEQLAAQIEELSKDEAKSLESTINNWQQQTEQSIILKDAERLLADYRNIGRMSSNELLRVHQDKIERLMAGLRQKEQQLENQKFHQKKLNKRLQDAENISEAERLTLEQQESKLRQQLDQMAQRARQTAAINRNLREDKVEKSKRHRQQLAVLNKELQLAETQAEISRQGLVLEAAKKIAEAERLAAEARLAKRHAMERAAIRLRMNADDIASYAAGIDSGHQIVIPALANAELPKFETGQKHADKGAKMPTANAENASKDTPLTPLEGMVVNIRQQEATLRDVFSSTFKGIEDRAGKWEVYWELKDENLNIPEERWTVIAEARLDEFLAYVRQTVLKNQGVELRFRRFDGSRLFVVSDK